MDPYHKKLSEMKGYVPFLDKMISRLEKVKDGTKDQQLSKMKDLLKILTDPDKKLRIETLVKCEGVLQTLYEKVEGKPLHPPRLHVTTSIKSSPDSPQKESTSYSYMPNAASRDRFDDIGCGKELSTPTSPRGIDSTPPIRGILKNTQKRDFHSSTASTDERSSNQINPRERNTGPGLLPTPILRPSYDPSHEIYPSGNLHATESNIRAGFSNRKGFIGPTGSNFSTNRYSAPNIGRPVNEPWTPRPPSYPLIRGGQKNPNRFTSPWPNQERHLSPWGQPSGFQSQQPPPTLLNSYRPNFNEQRPQPWLGSRPSIMNQDGTMAACKQRMEREWGHDDSKLPPQPFRGGIVGKLSQDEGNEISANKPTWPLNEPRNVMHSEKNNDTIWSKSNLEAPSASLPVVPPPPPRISDVVSPTSPANSRPMSTEPEDQDLATPDSPEPQDMGVIDTPASPDSSPTKNMFSPGASQNHPFVKRGHTNAKNDNPKVIPLERHNSKQSEEGEGSPQPNSIQSSKMPIDERQNAFQPFVIGQGAVNKPIRTLSSPPPSNKVKSSRWDQHQQDCARTESNSSDIGNKSRFKPIPVIESPASPPPATSGECAHQPLPTNIPTTGTSNVAHASTNQRNTLPLPPASPPNKELEENVLVKPPPHIRSQSQYHKLSQDSSMSRQKDPEMIPGGYRKTLLDTPIASATKSIYQSNWKHHHSAPSDHMPSPSQLDHPGSASNSPYSPYSPGRSPQQSSQHKSSSNSPYSPYSPNHSPQQGPPSTQPQILDRNTQLQKNIQHQLPTLPQILHQQETYAGMGQTNKLQNAEVSRPSPHQISAPKKKLRPLPEHRDSMSRFSQNYLPPMSAFQAPVAIQKKPMTYREYRKMKEEQRKKEEVALRAMNANNKSASNVGASEEPELQPSPLTSGHRNTDPRKRPSVLASEQAAARMEKEAKTTTPVDLKTKEIGGSGSALSNFKIPKKKKVGVDLPTTAIEGDTNTSTFIPESKELRASIKLLQRDDQDENTKGYEQKDSESDSEPELKIAEHETGSESDHDTTPSAFKIKDTEHSEKGKHISLNENLIVQNVVPWQKKSDYDEVKHKTSIKSQSIEIKENVMGATGFLQSIVASLEPEEAEKLLQKANLLENQEKITLKQLKLLLADDSDKETEKKKITSKRKKNVNNVKDKKPDNAQKEQNFKKSRVTVKIKPTPTPGVRKSRRLMQAETQINMPLPSEEINTATNTGNILVDSDDDDYNQLVIDEEIPTKDQSNRDSCGKSDNSRGNIVTVDFMNAIANIEDHSKSNVSVHSAKDISFADAGKKLKRGRGRPQSRGVRKGGNSVSPSNKLASDSDQSKPTCSTNLGEDENMKPNLIQTDSDTSEVDTSGEVVFDDSLAQGRIDYSGEKNQLEANTGRKEGGGIIKTDMDVVSTVIKPSAPIQMKKAKMKTWFPGVVHEHLKKRRKALKSQDEEITSPVTIKKEPMAVDWKVFIGLENFSPQNEFHTKATNYNEYQSEKLKDRLLKVKGLVQKLNFLSEGKIALNALDDDLEKVQSTAQQQENESISSEVQFGDIGEKNYSISQEMEIVLTQKPKLYSEGLRNVIDNLGSQVSDFQILEGKPINHDESNLSKDTFEEVSLLDVVKNLSKETKDNYLDQQEKDKSKFTNVSHEIVEIGDCRDKDLFNLTTNVKSIAEKGYKNDTTWLEMMKPVNLKHLFKCMVCSSCSFTSDNAAKFRMHLDEHSSSKKRDRHGWLHCAYCIQKWSSPDCLISHIIQKHGVCQYQCPYCFHRQTTTLGLFLHQQKCHSEKSKSMISCKSIPETLYSSLPVRVSYKPYKCRMSNCGYEATNTALLSNHLYLEHKKLTSSTDYQCMHCHCLFTSSARLILHCKAKHGNKAVLVNVRHVQTRLDLQYDEAEALLSSDEEESRIVEEALSSQTNIVPIVAPQPEEKASVHELDEGGLMSSTNNKVKVFDTGEGLAGFALYRCGNKECSFRTDNVIDFKHHITICKFSIANIYLTCFHCKKVLKHAATLLEHMKSHGVKRYFCSLCVSYRSALPLNVKTHMRSEHKVSNNFKLCPLNCGNSRPEEDMFVVMPRNALAKGNLSSRGSKIKDTFSPDEIDSMPPVLRWMSRDLLRCSVCDFSTKVRHNLVKHLRLHLRVTKKADIDNNATNISDEFKDVPKEQREKDPELSTGSLNDFNIPYITPINEPTGDDSLGKARMTSLLPEDHERDLLRKSFEKDLAMMPKLVQENKRFACCDRDCSYFTLDASMLLNHIQALHSELDIFICPHCKESMQNHEDSKIPFDAVEFHLKCHGELLFKCSYCVFYHWEKRTAETHVVENHIDQNILVRNVRKDQEEWDSRKRLHAPVGKDTKKELAIKAADQTVIYIPFKCGICDYAQETIEGIQEHIKLEHDMTKQFKCIFCELASDTKTEIESHFKSSHKDLSQNVALSLIQIFYVDNYNTNMSVANAGVMGGSNVSDSLDVEEKREPLWRRDMPGLKHIRGILYEEYPSADIVPSISSNKSRSLNKRSATAAENKHFSINFKPSSSTSQTGGELESTSKDIDEADNFPMKCRECNLQKKTIKGLKMHIKLMHLRTGKFLCQRCEFSANILNSINTHYKIKHPDAEKADFEERNDEAKAFTHEYWKDKWEIPTLDERKQMVESMRNNISNHSKENYSSMDYDNMNVAKKPLQKKDGYAGKVRVFSKGKMKRKLDNLQSSETLNAFGKAAKRRKKDQRRGVKRKPSGILDASNIGVDRLTTKYVSPHSQSNKSKLFSDTETYSNATKTIMESDKNVAAAGNNYNTLDNIAIKEISLFEQASTFKCQYCPKRTQSLERIERHLKAEHPERITPSTISEMESGEAKDTGISHTLEWQSGYKILTRDQVVDMLTLRLPAPASIDTNQTTDQLRFNTNLQNDYICFYCDDVVGNIYELKAHFTTEHNDLNNDKLMVKKLQIDSNKKLVTGYLECQICGYLSGGIDKSKQRVHFHDAHPLEETVNVSKYVLKQKLYQNIDDEKSFLRQSSLKFDPSKFIGMTIHCPKAVELRENKLVYHAEICNFETKNLAAMNGHLKKHTLTYKCGHCGKTYSNSSEFHQHTAMLHGNKIPDLVKDPEAVARFEALKGLAEANLQIKFDIEQRTNAPSHEDSFINANIQHKHDIEPLNANQYKQVARKSTAGEKQYTKVLNQKYTARKSTSRLLAIENFSHYGNQVEPIDYSSIITQMSMGGMPIILNAAKMAELININPKVLVKDCMQTQTQKDEETQN